MTKPTRQNNSKETAAPKVVVEAVEFEALVGRLAWAVDTFRQAVTESHQKDRGS